MTGSKPKSQDPDDHKKTPGEVVFDRTVYTGIGFGVNEGLSLWITDQFVNGKNLLKNIPGLDKAGEWFSKSGYEKVSESVTKTFKFTDKVDKTGKLVKASERGANSVLFVTLLAGGTLLVLPMKWLEDHKAYWVKKANHLTDKFKGSKLTPEEVEKRDEEVEQHIADQPKQSWTSILLGRAVGATASVGSGMLVGPERNKKLMNASEKLFTGKVQPEGQKSAANRYAALASLEAYSCFIMSVVLEVSSKMFAKNAAKKQKEEVTEEAPKTLMTDAQASTGESSFAKNEAAPAESHAAAIQSQREQVSESALQV